MDSIVLAVIIIAAAVWLFNRLTPRSTSKTKTFQLHIEAPELTISPSEGARVAEPTEEITYALDREEKLAGGTEFLRLAAAHQIPLEITYLADTGRQRTETVVPQFDSDDAMKGKQGQIRVSRVVNAVMAITADDLPGFSAFVRALSQSTRSRVRELAVLASHRLDRDERMETLERMSNDEADYVRGFVADATRSFTARVRREVSKKRYTFLADQDPQVFALLSRLAVDPARVVRQKAAYALGDHPQGAELLNTLLRDDAEKVREAASHAINRLDEQEMIRSAYERAVEMKAQARGKAAKA